MVADETVVIEACLKRGANAQVAAVDLFERLAQDMGAAMPEDHFGLRVLPVQQVDLAVSLERPAQIVQFPLLVLLLLIFAFHVLQLRTRVDHVVLDQVRDLATVLHAAGYYLAFLLLETLLYQLQTTRLERHSAQLLRVLSMSHHYLDALSWQFL